ncbi:MAG: hypothetical protein ACRYGP_11200 [Janthinobacterium lividum]
MARGGGLLWPVAAALACAAGTAILVVTLFTMWRLHVSLPYWDEWSSIIDLQLLEQGRYGLADLAGQHNEHRILFPRLVFWADARFFAMSGVLNLTVTVLLQMANAFILLALVRGRTLRTVQLLLLAGFVVVLLFSLRQEQNFTNGYQLQFVGVYTAAALATVAYVRALERVDDRAGRSAPLFGLAALACGISAYTMANGMLAGFVLTAIAILRGSSRQIIVTTVVLSSLLGAVYLHGYTPGDASFPLREVPSHLWAYPRYLTAYLGNPLGSNLRVTQALGVLGLILAAAAAWRVATLDRHDGGDLVLLGIMGFVLASAALTSYGRVALGTEQASESRYATPSLIFWCALVLFWFPVVFGQDGPTTPTRSVSTRVWPPALGALMLLLAGASVWFEASAWPDLASRSAALRHVSDSLISGLFDNEAASSYENNSAADIANLVPHLRTHHLAAFADPAFALSGQVIDPAKEASPCPGSVTVRADPVLGTDGLRLAGTVPKQDSGPVTTRIVIADSAARVAGFGSAALPGEPRRLWSGYARGRPGQELQAFASVGSDRYCALGHVTVEAQPPA